MARRQETEVIVRVTYVNDPERARAAQEILKEGFRRGMLRVMDEKQKRQDSL
ncbi:MAG TPA: hypothetical protein VD969_06840 [Symbiobacteriaceae bacterium]|nr:hypothetical protein [Symbiobacteriaceae bacterium]